MNYSNRSSCWREGNKKEWACTLVVLQQFFERDLRGRWAAHLIKDMRLWFNLAHGEVSYIRYFQFHLHKIGKPQLLDCTYSKDMMNNDCHTFFFCKQHWLVLAGSLSSIGVQHLVRKCISQLSSKTMHYTKTAGKRVALKLCGIKQGKCEIPEEWGEGS